MTGAKGRGLGALLRALWPPLLLAAALIGGWQLAGQFAVRNPQVLPTPAQVVSAGWDQRGALWQNTVPTLEETAIGFGLSFAMCRRRIKV